MRIQAFLALASVVPSLASAAEPVHLAPSSPWVVDYAENSCRLVRQFGDGKDVTTLAFESEAPGMLDMLAIGEPLASFSDEVSAKFVPTESKPMRGETGKTADKAVPMILVVRARLLPDQAIADEEKRDRAEQGRPSAVSLAEKAAKKAMREAFAANTTAIEIDPRKNRSVILDTGSLGDAVKALDECSRDSLRDWGVDPDLEDKIVRPVWADAGRWFSADDYPKDLLVLGQESVVKVRVLVDATGRVTKCTTVSHFNAPEFNRITCAKFTERVHFKPAELADGTKVPSYYVNNVVFRIGP
jgi:hypothetical protein